MPPKPQRPQSFTTAEAAAELGYGPQTIRNWLQASPPILKGARTEGGHWRIPKSEIDRVRDTLPNRRRASTSRLTVLEQRVARLEAMPPSAADGHLEADRDRWRSRSGALEEIVLRLTSANEELATELNRGTAALADRLVDSSRRLTAANGETLEALRQLIIPGVLPDL